MRNKSILYANQPPMIRTANARMQGDAESSYERIFASIAYIFLYCVEIAHTNKYSNIWNNIEWKNWWPKTANRQKLSRKRNDFFSRPYRSHSLWHKSNSLAKTLFILLNSKKREWNRETRWKLALRPLCLFTVLRVFRWPVHRRIAPPLHPTQPSNKMHLFSQWPMAIRALFSL